MHVYLPALRRPLNKSAPAKPRAEPDSPAFYDAYWQNTRSDVDPHVVRKADALLRLVPDGVRTIVDVGCGDGVLTTALAQRYQVQAVDRSEAALARLAARAPHVARVCASAEQLPMADQSADLVFSSELLEHLPAATRERAVREMARVTRRWLLVSVPNQEVLRRRFAQCPACGLEFHVYGHLQSFSTADLAGQFPGFSVRAQLEHGRPERLTHPRIEQFRQQRAGRWFVYPGLHVTCPDCACQRFALPHLGAAQWALSGATAIADGIWRVAQRRTVRPYWMTLLLERDDPDEPRSADAPAANRVASDVGAVVAGRVAVAALDSVKFFALVRLLDKSAYGTLAFALALHLSAMTLGTLAVPDSLLALLPRASTGQQAALARQSLQLLGALGVLVGLGVLAAGHIPALLPAGQPALPLLLPWLALAIAADLPAQMLQAFLLGIRQHRRAATRALGLAAVANLALLVPVLLGAPLWQVAACFALASIVRLLVTVGTVIRAFPDVAPEPFAGGLRTQLEMAIPLSLTGLTATLNRQLTTWTAGFLLPAALFADFAVGAQELPLVAMLPNAVAVALLPHLTHLMRQPVQRREGLALWHASMLRVALVVLPVWVWCSVETVPLLTAMGGPRWASAAVPFRLTALLLPLRLTAYGTVLLALGLPRVVLRAQVAAMATTLLGCGLLWLAHGQGLLTAHAALVGGCAAFVLSQFVAIALLLRGIAGGVGVTWSAAFPWRAWAIRLGVAASAMVPVALLPALPLSGPSGEVLNLGWRTGLYATLALTAFWRLDLLTAADRDVVRSGFRLSPAAAPTAPPAQTRQSTPASPRSAESPDSSPDA